MRINEAWWAAGGAALLVIAGTLSPQQAVAALERGINVYLFLIGMMALAEFARVEGVFDWIATHAVRAAGSSRARLLILIYGAGIVTTAFLSNDATIVVLTPAVLAALAKTDAPPEPYVFGCAFVANAASLVLPIANPSNLLFFAGGMPPLGAWFGAFALASVASIVLTYAALALVFRRTIAAPLMVVGAVAPSPPAFASRMLIFAAAALVATAAFGGPLGEVTFALGACATVVAAMRDRAAGTRIVHGIAWPIVALTAGLFVVVEALDLAGAASLPRALYGWAQHVGGPFARVGIAAAAALASNALNNLPVGLDLGRYVGAGHPAPPLAASALVGVNIGPNLTASGSLATLLWLAILRRAGLEITPLRFAVVGAAVTPAALVVAALLTR